MKSKTPIIFVISVIGVTVFGFVWYSNATLMTGESEDMPLLTVEVDLSFVSPEDVPTTEEEWRNVLTGEQYYILRQQGTERPYSSPLNSEKRSGTYVTADCGDPVFRSEQKYDSGTGWPSFWAPIDDNVLEFQEDYSVFLGTRIEILSRCGGHLGHLFADGPEPTGQRYCINGDALIFIPDEE